MPSQKKKDANEGLPRDALTGDIRPATVGDDGWASPSARSTGAHSKTGEAAMRLLFSDVPQVVLDHGDGFVSDVAVGGARDH